MKLTRPKEKLARDMAWVEGFSQSQVWLIGVLEVLGALGLILPVLIGVLPWLTPLAAIGLALMMVGAVTTHIRLREYLHVIVPLVFLALAGFTVFRLLRLMPL